MDCNNLIPVNIYYQNPSLEHVLAESKQDFPLAETAINLEREHPAETQAHSNHEIVQVVLDPKLVDSLLGIANVGLAAGVADGGKRGDQTTEALYGWIRQFLKRLIEDFKRDFSHARYPEGILGPRLDIISGNDAELKCQLHIAYSGKGFSIDRLWACLDIFELIVRPIIATLSETVKVRAVMIQGHLGFSSESTWSFKVETTDHRYSFPEIPLDGVTDSATAQKVVSDWTRRSREIKKTLLKTCGKKRSLVIT